MTSTWQPQAECRVALVSNNGSRSIIKRHFLLTYIYRLYLLILDCLLYILYCLCTVYFNRLQKRGDHLNLTVYIYVYTCVLFHHLLDVVDVPILRILLLFKRECLSCDSIKFERDLTSGFLSCT